MENNIKVGVGLYIINENNELLLGLRKSNHGNATWSPSGGKLEFGEEFTDAAIRETKEETNLDINPEDIKIIGITNDLHISEKKHIITIHMITNKYSGDVKLMEPDKFEKWQWFSLDNLPEKLFLPVNNFLKNNSLSELI